MEVGIYNWMFICSEGKEALEAVNRELRIEIKCSNPICYPKHISNLTWKIEGDMIFITLDFFYQFRNPYYECTTRLVVLH